MMKWRETRGLSETTVDGGKIEVRRGLIDSSRAEQQSKAKQGQGWDSGSAYVF